MFRQPEVPCLVVVSQLPHPFLGDSLYVIMCFTGLAKNKQRADGGNWAIGSTEWPLAQAGRNQEVQYSVVFNFFWSGWWRSLFWLGCVATRAASGFCWCPTHLFDSVSMFFGCDMLSCHKLFFTHLLLTKLFSSQLFTDWPPPLWCALGTRRAWNRWSKAREMFPGFQCGLCLLPLWGRACARKLLNKSGYPSISKALLERQS